MDMNMGHGGVYVAFAPRPVWDRGIVEGDEAGTVPNRTRVDMESAAAPETRGG